MAFDTNKRWEMRTINIFECINNVLKHVMSVPITACVQFIFERVNKYFEERRAVAASSFDQGWTEVVLKQLDAWRLHSGGHTVTSYDRSTGIFQVLTHHKLTTQTINLTDRT